jgi:hypothetical protein
MPERNEIWKESKMIKVVSFILLVALTALACDWSTIESQDGKYVYTRECHLEVGRLTKKYDLKIKQIDILEDMVSEFEKVLDLQVDRTNLWKEYSEDVEKKYTQVKKNERFNFWVNFGLGVVVTSLSVYLAGNLARK